MKTQKDILNEVLRYGFQDGPLVNESRITEWINEGQLQIARKVDSPVFQAQAEITMVSQTAKYSEPTEFLRMASIVYPLVAVRLKPIDLQTYDSLFSANTGTGTGIEGPPIAYTLYKKEIWLFPTPTNADKLELRYYKRPPRISGTEEPVLEEDYLHLLVDYSLWRAYRAEDDPEMAQQHQTQYERDLMIYKSDVTIWGQQDDRPRVLQGSWGLPM